MIEIDSERERDKEREKIEKRKKKRETFWYKVDIPIHIILWIVKEESEQNLLEFI